MKTLFYGIASALVALGLPGANGQEDPAVRAAPPADPEAVALTSVTNAVGFVEPYALLDFSSRSASRLFDQRPSRPSADFLWDSLARFNLNDMESVPEFAPFLKASLPELVKMSEAFPDNAPVLAVLGVRLFQTNRIEESVSAFARAYEADPEYERCSELYSAVLVIAGELETAVRKIPRMLDVFPHNRPIRFNAACAYGRQTNVAKALQHLALLADIGWHEVRTHLNDRDLDPVRSDPAFVRFSGELDRRARERILRNLAPADASALSIRGQL